MAYSTPFCSINEKVRVVQFKYPNDALIQPRKRSMECRTRHTPYGHNFAYVAEKTRGYQVLTLDVKLFPRWPTIQNGHILRPFPFGECATLCWVKFTQVRS